MLFESLVQNESFNYHYNILNSKRFLLSCPAIKSASKNMIASTDYARVYVVILVGLSLAYEVIALKSIH
jgi:hypothetical protein